MTSDERPPQRGGFLQPLREFLYGLAGHEHTMVALQEKAALEHLFMVVILGEFLGIPLLRPYHALRLLPYMVPRIESWRRAVLRERDWTDKGFE